MSDRIPVFQGSKRSDRQGIGLAVLVQTFVSCGAVAKLIATTAITSLSIGSGRAPSPSGSSRVANAQSLVELAPEQGKDA